MLEAFLSQFIALESVTKLRAAGCGPTLVAGQLRAAGQLWLRAAGQLRAIAGCGPTAGCGPLRAAGYLRVAHISKTDTILS